MSYIVYEKYRDSLKASMHLRLFREDLYCFRKMTKVLAIPDCLINPGRDQEKLKLSLLSLKVGLLLKSSVLFRLLAITSSTALILSFYPQKFVCLLLSSIGYQIPLQRWPVLLGENTSPKGVQTMLGFLLIQDHSPIILHCLPWSFSVLFDKSFCFLIITCIF